MTNLLVVALASLFAGLVDAIGGGGGLILVPALFGVFPTAAPATLFGTNKGAALCGTGWATAQYAKQVKLSWSTLLPAAIVAMAGSFAGAWAVSLVPAAELRRALPLVLFGVLLYTLARKDLGLIARPRLAAKAEITVASTIGLVVGFYDGFFGPGTGSFFVFLFVRFLGYDFLNASASAKLLNTFTNVAAIILFASTGHVWWHIAAVMAVANVAGSLLGTFLALKHGSRFVRVVFITVVAALIVKTGWDGFAR
jgi:uncharacterized protein